MSRRLLVLGIVAIVVGLAAHGSAQYKPDPAWQGLDQVKPNAYGLGVNRDEYGRPHSYWLNDGQRLDPLFQEGVKRNGYGLGAHMDQFGRPVYDGPVNADE